MTKITSDYRVPEQGIPDFEHLMEIKALSKERSAFQRGAWRAQYDALSPEEKALADEKFNKMFVKIAAQFGRSRRFIFEGNDKSTPDIDESK
ncbi:hypothetical protein [Pseudomonas thivervalensis]|uniref:hypothetical protein n=1 Tax=Pseudomonas thivervalensis TaxID=86265 RepID=UPI00069D3465|nr:hypothetical protein [Pseudomonas thivervalensis]